MAGAVWPLEKKSRRVHLIAVGCTLRRLVAICHPQPSAQQSLLLVVDDMAELLSPRHVDYGVRGRVEATVHATRRYLMNLPSGHALLKLDFKNAFNSVWQDKMLEAVQKLALISTLWSIQLTLALLHFTGE